jgi:hypothetical protein
MVQSRVQWLTFRDPSHFELLEHLERLEPPQLRRQSFALADKLPLVKILQFGQRGDLVNILIVPDSLDSGKAQSEPGAVLRAMLDLIVGDLDNDVRFDGDRIAVISDL